MLDLIGLIFSFSIIIFLVVKKIRFGFAMIIGSIILGVTAFDTISSFMIVVWSTLKSPATMNLTITILLIAFLANLMKETGQVELMTTGIKNMIGDSRAILAGAPALFGLLPMLGGALLSAPIVEEEGKKLKISPADKTFLNHWFRHIWFYIFPLFPGLILASNLSGINIYKLASLQIPMFLTAFVVGLFFLNRIPSGEAMSRKSDKVFLRIFIGASPILTALLISIVFNLPILIGVISAVILSIILSRLKLEKIKIASSKGLSPSLALAIIGIVLFKEIVENSGAMNTLRDLILSNNIPVILVVSIIPFIIGFTMGSDIAAIGLSFPIILPMLPEVNLGLVSLLYISGFTGYLISPIHLCIVLTLDYFSASIRSFYPKLLFSVGIVLIVTVMVLVTFSRFIL